MKLAKPRLDLGLNTNTLAEMLRFWGQEAALPFDHRLPVRRGHEQYRFDALGSVIKINHRTEPLPDAPMAGYRELIVARPGLTAPHAMADPDGNRVSLVPPGRDGVDQIGIRMAVRDLAAHRRFYVDILGFSEAPWPRGAAFRGGESLLLAEESADAPTDAEMPGLGWRYMTLQVFKVDEEHARALSLGAREAMAPVTLGTTARISMIRDPDGNWIELSQRASIVGTLI